MFFCSFFVQEPIEELETKESFSLDEPTSEALDIVESLVEENGAKSEGVQQSDEDEDLFDSKVN